MTISFLHTGALFHYLCRQKTIFWSVLCQSLKKVSICDHHFLWSNCLAWWRLQKRRSGAVHNPVEGATGGLHSPCRQVFFVFQDSLKTLIFMSFLFYRGQTITGWWALPSPMDIRNTKGVRFPFKEEYVLFLKVFGWYRSENTTGDIP